MYIISKKNKMQHKHAKHTTHTYHACQASKVLHKSQQPCTSQHCTSQYGRLEHHTRHVSHALCTSCLCAYSLHGPRRAKPQKVSVVRVSFHPHVIHDVCLSVRWLSFVFLPHLFLSVIYLFSSTLYLISARHSFHVENAEG